MGIIKNLKEEVRIIKERDPALKSPMEVLLYPFLHGGSFVSQFQGHAPLQTGA